MIVKTTLFFCMFYIVGAWNSNDINIRQKRQLFRESLLPHQGGKIPDSAFVPERLTTNKLQQHGFYTIDGLVLEKRNPDAHHHNKKYPSPTIKLNLAPDNEHVAPPGRIHSPRVVETTYIIREPVRYNFHPQQVLYYHHLPFSPMIKYLPRKPNEYTNAAIQIFKEFQPYLKTLHAYD